MAGTLPRADGGHDREPSQQECVTAVMLFAPALYPGTNVGRSWLGNAAYIAAESSRRPPRAISDQVTHRGALRRVSTILQT